MTTIEKKTFNTLWDLMDGVRAVIAQEPQCYNQETFVDTSGCRTAYCVAGWMFRLVIGRELVESEGAIAACEAKQLLRRAGIEASAIQRLFSAVAVDGLAAESTGRAYINMHESIGTTDYAAFGVEHVTRFMNAHEGQLRACLLGLR